MRVTIAVPEALTSDANQLARCIGLGPDDERTYGEATWVDGLGNLYTLASAVVSESFLATASSPLAEPAWGCDLAAATRAQAQVRIGVSAAPDIMAAVIGDDVTAALATLGVSNV